MKNKIFFVCIIVVIMTSASGCVKYIINSVAKTNTKLKIVSLNDTIINTTRHAPHNFTSAYKLMNPESALKFAETNEQKQAAKALQFVMQGALDSAANLYAEAIRKRDSCDYLWIEFLENYYCDNHLWERYEQYSNLKIARKNDSTNSNKLFKSCYKNISPFNIEFSNDLDVDTIPIVVKACLPYIKLKINGMTCWFIVDTGADITVLYKDFADMASIIPLNDTDTLIGSGVSGKFNLYYSFFDTLKINNTTITNVPLKIIGTNSLKSDFLLFNIAYANGIIGWDILQHFDFTIDYKNKQLIFRKPIKKDNQVRNLFWYEKPIVKFYIGENNQEAFYTFDTGAIPTDLFLTSEMGNIFGNIDELELNARGMLGANGEIIRYEYKTLPKFELLTYLDNTAFVLNIKNAEVGITNWRKNLNITMGESGNIGSGYFYNKAVHIDILNGIFEILE
jgi:hypothetical protein